MHTVKTHVVEFKSLQNILPASQHMTIQKMAKTIGSVQVGQAIQVPDELQEHKNISSECAQNLRAIMPKILS